MEQIAAAKIKIYEFPEVMLLHLLRDKSLLACPPEVSPYPLFFFPLFYFVASQVEDGEEAERKENRRMKVRFYQRKRPPSNWRSSPNIIFTLLQLHVLSIISIWCPAIMATNHQERVPFAVVGSNTTIEGEGGKKSRGRKYFEFTDNHNGTPTPGRKYPWGVVDIENLQHCDFLPLRNMLIKVCSIHVDYCIEELFIAFFFLTDTLDRPEGCDQLRSLREL